MTYPPRLTQPFVSASVAIDVPADAPPVRVNFNSTDNPDRMQVVIDAGPVAVYLYGYCEDLSAFLVRVAEAVRQAAQQARRTASA